MIGWALGTFIAIAFRLALGYEHFKPTLSLFLMTLICVEPYHRLHCMVMRISHITIGQHTGRLQFQR